MDGNYASIPVIFEITGYAASSQVNEISTEYQARLQS